MNIQNNTLPDNPNIEVIKAKETGLFTNYIFKAIPLAFDESMSYYETLCGLLNYLQNTIIPTVNNNADAVSELQSLYEELRTYVDDYFTNLDVQNEINNKLDALVKDGTLTNLIGNYVNPLINAQNVEITNFKNNVNSQLNEMNQEIQSVISGTPLVADTIEQMTDTSRIYVLTSDGNWYYYNGTNWISGGAYQSTGIGENSVGLKNLKNDVINERYTSSNTNYFNPFDITINKGIKTNTGAITDDDLYWLTNKISLSAGESIRVEQSSDYYNTIAKPKNAYKYGVYRNDDTMITVVSNNSLYTAEEDCYIIFQFAKASIPLTERFKLIIRKQLNSFGVNDYKNFYPYTLNDQNNIGLNIDENDFKNNAKNRLIGLKDLSNEFEIGTIYSGSNVEGNVPNRVRSKTIINMPIGTKIVSDGNVSFKFMFYDENDNYLNTYTEFNISEYLFTENKRVRIIGSMNPQADINDVNEWLTHIQFIPNINLIINSLKENNIISSLKSINYTGNKINLNNKFYYEEQNFTTLKQDSCEYNDKVFIFNYQGQFKVYDLITETETQLFNLDQYNVIKPHCNAVFFGNQKYSDGDLYPILYVNAYNTSGLPLGTLYAHRIIYDSENNVYSTQLLQTIKIGFTDNEIWTIPGDIRPYGNFILNTDTNELYAFTLRGENTRFFKFDMPSIFSGDTILTIDDIKNMFDTEYFPYIQGCCYSNNQIFCLNGNNTIIDGSSYLRVIDLTLKKCMSNIPLTSIMIEPESIFVYDNHLYIGQDRFYKCN